MSTVLRLPHMDIVLECDNKVRNTGTKRLAHAKMVSPRRSGRLRNVSGVNQDHMQQTKNNVKDGSKTTPNTVLQALEVKALGHIQKTDTLS